MATFGDLLRRLRGSRTQKEVASGLEIPVTTLSTLENQEAVPRGAVLKKLAEYYGVPLTYFYSAPTAQVKATDAAKAWLQEVRKANTKGSNIATHASPDFPEDVKERVAALIRERKNG